MTAPAASRNLALPAIWNANFGFLGIQFGWGLQMANMSAIYRYLGAQESSIPILWLAAPVTGLLVQPIIGHYSDRTWTRLGRRRPYFLGGAILATAALIAMPHASALWMAAGLLWVLDASINISMEPFRAFVGDLLPPGQRTVGYSMQSLLMGLGAVLSSALPWMLTRLGLVTGTGGTSRIPPSVQAAFTIGAVAFIGCVLVTVITTPEYPPEPGAAMPVRRSAVREIVSGIRAMPGPMRRLAVVQFFTWLGLFCMWLYFTPAVAARFFGGAPGSATYARGVEWGGVCFSTYNGVGCIAAFILIALSRRGVGTRRLHRIGLICAAAGLGSVGLWTNAHLLIVSMVGVGIGWAAILSMPYALLANAIPPGKMGFYMGVFNFFVVLPQIVASATLGPLVAGVFGGHGFPVVLLGGGCFAAAAIALSWVPDSGEVGVAAPARQACSS